MELMPKEETMALRDQYIGKSCQLFFRERPLKIIKGQAQYLYDEKGAQYLDCINNVQHVGHCHPHVVKAGVEQMMTLNTNNRFLHDNIVLCAQKIVSTMPGNLSVCFFVNSGSEANDLAIRLSQNYTKNKDVIALEHAYHGHLTSLIDLSHYKFNLPGGTGQKDHVHIAPCPDTYRGKFRAENNNTGKAAASYAEEVKKLCDKVQSKKDRGVCAFIAESMLSCGGQIIPPEGYMKEVYEHVRAAGGLCIADEVQVGFGRMGHWWGFETHDVIPDIVTMGKPMGNGHPVAAVVTTPEIAESFNEKGVGYFNTYGGNPVSCAIANAVFEVIETENLREHAMVLGEYLLDECHMLMKKHKMIGDVRGSGLFVGIELVKDRNTKTPDKESALYVVERMRDEHILLSRDGPDNNVLKLKPPMCFTKENVKEFIQTLDKILKELRQKLEQRAAKSPSKTTEVPSMPSQNIKETNNKTADPDLRSV